MPPFADLLNYRSDWSTLTKLRLSVIEKGRYSDIPIHNRICAVCSTTSVENEIHLLLECSAYSREREDFFLKLNQLSNKLHHKVLNVSHLYNLFNSKNVTG